MARKLVARVTAFGEGIGIEPAPDLQPGFAGDLFYRRRIGDVLDEQGADTLFFNLVDQQRQVSNPKPLTKITPASAWVPVGYAVPGSL